MKRNIKKRTVAIFIIGLFTLSCSLLNLGGAEGPPEALTQYANPIEETSNDAIATNTNEAATSSSNDVDTSVPDGTYVGTTTIPAYWDGFSEGGWGGKTIEENEITIIVSPYGDVSGGVIFVWKGNPVPIESCVWTINMYSTATLSGRLTETGGTIDIAEEFTRDILRSGCPADSETLTINNNYQAQVSIIGNRIIRGEVSGYFMGTFSFEATKQ